MKALEPIKIILVDDHRMFLEGLKMILSETTNIHVIKSYQNAHEALDELDKTNPDLILTDYNMPIMNGVDFTKAIKALHSDIKVLVLSMHNDQKTVRDIFDAEADGYVLKNSDSAELIKAILAIANGGTYYANEIVSLILSSNHQKTKIREAESIQVLSQREIEVIELIALELTSDEIADQLFISKRTVETHRKKMLAKTSASSTIGLLKYAVRTGLVQFG